MQIKHVELQELQEILLNEYGTALPEEVLLSEALRLSEFAKAIVRHNLSKNIKNKE